MTATDPNNSNQLRNVICREFHGLPEKSSIEIDMLHWMKRGALEYIAQGGLGYSFGSLSDTNTNEYSESVRNFA